MNILYWILSTTLVQAAPEVDAIAMELANEYLLNINTQSPYGRLQVAINAYEDNAPNATILALGNTHPHIAVMLTDPVQKSILEYISSLPVASKNKLRKGDGIIRNSDEMSKQERKKLAILSKSLSIPKKVEAIRISSFDGIQMMMELSYKEQGNMKRKEISLARPFAPVSAQNARNQIETALGAKAVPPANGPFSLMPFNNASFEFQMTEWTVGECFRFENQEPIGSVIVDTDQTMDGRTALKFYNTEETMVFPNVSQKIPVGSTYKVQFQGFVKSKNTRIEYRQEPDFSAITLNYINANGESVKKDQQVLRLGTYDWESVIIDSFVPQEATHLELILSSSVSGTYWIDGLSLIRQD